MDYISTRDDKGKTCDFEKVLLDGLAPDGGLYVPIYFPKFSIKKIQSLKNLDYSHLVYEVTKEFVQPSISYKDYLEICKKTYDDFGNKNEISITKLNNKESILNLFHGPTAAFKDFALQLLGNIYDYILKKKKINLVILGATSGDTGSAAINGCSKSEKIKIFILFPNNKVSDVQRRQMTTFKNKNVYNLAIDGDFDDCQNIVKEIFRENHKVKKYNLSGVNSINWARIMGQIVYYFWSYLRICKMKEKLSFSVPTGNFGNIYAGFVAKQMGLPIQKLVIASNLNDVLKRFLDSGKMSLKKTQKTLSPSMDIQISSNFERLLFYYYGNSSKPIKKLYSSLKKNKSFSVSQDILQNIKQTFKGGKIDDKQTISTIKDIYEKFKLIIDPHTAVGLQIGRKILKENDQKIVYLATAHYAKFLDSIKYELNHFSNLELPKNFADLFNLEEKFEILGNNVNVVKAFMSENLTN